MKDRYSEILLVVCPDFCTSFRRLSRKAMISTDPQKTALPHVSWKFSDLSVVMNTSMISIALE